MKILLSTAKTMDFKNSNSQLPFRMPQHMDGAVKIAALLKAMSCEDIQKKMKLSSTLAHDTCEKIRNWNVQHSGVPLNHALFAFSGTVFEKMNPQAFTDYELEMADKTIRIICGLYGFLRPLDTVIPYRLEMGVSLSPYRFRSLSDFWKDTLTSSLKADLMEDKTPFVVNLASNEFTKAVDLKGLGVPVVTPVFKEFKSGKLRTVAVFAKQLRGEMTRWIITQSLKTPDDLKNFSCNGYCFDSMDEKAEALLFVKKV